MARRVNHTCTSSSKWRLPLRMRCSTNLPQNKKTLLNQRNSLLATSTGRSNPSIVLPIRCWGARSSHVKTTSWTSQTTWPRIMMKSMVSPWRQTITRKFKNQATCLSSPTATRLCFLSQLALVIKDRCSQISPLINRTYSFIIIPCRQHNIINQLFLVLPCLQTTMDSGATLSKATLQAIILWLGSFLKLRSRALRTKGRKIVALWCPSAITCRRKVINQLALPCL